MARTARRNRAKNKTNNSEMVLTSRRIAINNPPSTVQVYDANRYVKRDLKWSALTALFIVVLLVISYILFH